MRDADHSERLKQLAQRYLAAIERGDVAGVAASLHVDMVQQEFPNRLNPQGQLRDRTALLASFELGRTVLAVQHFETQSVMVTDDRVALEVLWTGTLGADIGESLKAGSVLKARFALFLTFKDGQIVSQTNYDCFDPW